MKITLFSIAAVTFMTLTLLLNSSAQILSQKHLPEGAMTRIGKGLANDVKYSPDGTLIAVASSIGIWIYDAHTYQEIDLLTEHSEYVWSIAFSPDGQTLAGGNNGTIKLWDVETRQLKATLKGSGGWIMGVAFSPDGRTLASGDWNELKLWDVEDRQLKATLKGHTQRIWSVAFSPDGRTLASGSSDSTVCLWDVATGRLKNTIPGPATEVRSVAYSPDGRTLASGSWDSGGGNPDSTVRLWDVATGRLKHTVSVHSSGVAFSPDGQTLASMGWGSMTLLDVDTGQQKAILRGIVDFGGGVAFSPDGRTLAGVNYSMVKLWDVNTEQHKADLTGHVGTSPNIAFSPDGQTLASTDHRRVRLWDANTGQHKIDLTGHAGTMAYKYNHSTIAFSPNGQILAGLNESTIVLSDVGTGQQKMKLMGHTGSIQSVVFSRDGQTLATGSSAEVRLWDVNTGQQKMILQDPDLNGSLIAYSPDGRTLATRGPEVSALDNPTIRLWNTVTGKPLKVLTGHTTVPRSFVFSPDGRTLVSGGWGELLLWDLVSGQQKYAFQVAGRCNASGLALNSDGSILVTEWDGTDVALWNVATRKQLTTFAGHGNEHQHQITNLAFNPNGSMVASAAVDGTVLLWDVTPFIPEPGQQDVEVQQTQPEIVRLIYFRPSDRLTRQGIDTELDTLIRRSQYFFAEQMQNYGRKTFAFETDATGHAKVHHVTGTFTDTYYHSDTYNKVVNEVMEQFDTSREVFLIAVDVSSEFINNEGTCGIGGGGWKSHNSELWRRDFGGTAVIPASGVCINPSITTHELGHAFGLGHDFRDDAYLMAYGTQERLSPCAAEWLDVHRYFNTGQTGSNEITTIEMRSQRASHVQLQIADADGLHQVQLLIPTTADDPGQGPKLHSCKTLNGTLSSTFEFVTTELTEAAKTEVTLQVIDVHGNITKHVFPIETDDVVDSTNNITVSVSPSSVQSPGIGQQLTLSLHIVGGSSVAGYQVTVQFDASALRYVDSANGDYLPPGAFFVPPVVTGNSVGLAATSLVGESDGAGTLATVTFEVVAVKASAVTLSEVLLSDSATQLSYPDVENGEVVVSPRVVGDVNSDGVVNIQDLVRVGSSIGQTGPNAADVNGDGVVNIADLVTVANAFGNAAAAPMIGNNDGYSLQVRPDLNAEIVQKWLDMAHAADDGSLAFRRGIAVLEQFLAVLAPKETALLPNYPNPFNPETWIPYQLSSPSDITVCIYDINGNLVRRLALGHQAAGVYQSRSRAAYWEGKNEFDEPVASGVYFYTLTADDFTATRKMLIRK